MDQPELLLTFRTCPLSSAGLPSLSRAALQMHGLVIPRKKNDQRLSHLVEHWWTYNSWSSEPALWRSLETVWLAATSAPVTFVMCLDEWLWAKCSRKPFLFSGCSNWSYWQILLSVLTCLDWAALQSWGGQMYLNVIGVVHAVPQNITWFLYNILITIFFYPIWIVISLNAFQITALKRAFVSHNDFSPWLWRYVWADYLADVCEPLVHDY